MTARTILISAAVIAVVACNQADMLRRFTPSDADARARSYLAQLKRGQVDSAEAQLVPALDTPEVREQLTRIAAVLGDGVVDTSRVIGAQVNRFNGIRHTVLTYEMHSPAGWVLANVATVDSAGAWSVEGVAARPLARTLEEESRFTLADKSPRHYLWLLLTVLSAVLSLGGAVYLATRRAMPGHWRWALLSLLGVGAFSLNWTTGGVGFNLINIQLGGAAFLRAGPAAPWIITFAAPVGAIMALARYRRWRAGTTGAVGAAEATVTTPSEAQS